MALRIKTIEKNSQADILGILPGEKVLSINQHPIRDFIDLQFYAADEKILLEIERLNGSVKLWEIDNLWEKPLGITAEDHQIKKCINHCIFCFIDQMPPHQRQSLYLKDDDLCFSFYYGNFITMTNLSDRDFSKIIEQFLSPLYISVHTTNPVLHRKMLRYNTDFDLLANLQLLCNNHIALHTQIVIVPGYNDGDELKKTLNDLKALGDCCQSIGIVPVGLTKFRNKLTQLRSVSKEEALQLLKLADSYERTWCSDEIYITSGVDIPDYDYYEEFEQIENGIGMIRMMLTNWEENKEEFIRFIGKSKKKLVFVTGILAEPYMNAIARDINDILKDKARLQSVINYYMGETVTVAGLLTFEDIYSQVKLDDNEVLVLPSNVFNGEGYTLDGLHQNDICSKYNKPLLIVNEQFNSWHLIQAGISY